MIVGHIGGGEAGSYEIAKSLRFRASASAYLSKSVAGNAQTNSFSFWVKRGVLSSLQVIYGWSNGATHSVGLSFTANNELEVHDYVASSYVFRKITSAVFRDSSAHLHIQVTLDTTNAVAEDRVRLYVNGVRITAFSTSINPTQNYSSQWNNGLNVIGIGRQGGTGNYYFDGYLSEINFIDGQALTPSSFGQTDPSTGQWTHKKYAGTYGTNGFYLPFNDGSNLTNLCLDRSGNANNWTATNVSLTAGATYDWMDDTPTNNFATLSPLAGDSLATLANGNIRLRGGNASGNSRFATVGVNSGKWYFEYTYTTAAGIGGFVGVSTDVNQTTALTGVLSYYANGNKYNGATPSSYGGSWTQGDVIGVAIDMDAGTLTFYKNNVSQGVAFTSISGTFFPMGRASNSGGEVIADLNFGQRPFTYAPPAGFKALCTKNLPIPTGAAVEPKKHFDVLLHTGGASSSQDVTGTQFQPDFAWIKARSATRSHGLFDVVRGATAYLASDLTSTESVRDGQAFLYNGFRVDRQSGQETNTKGETYVAWLWKAGGAAVTNNAGTITSKVSANTAAGFSIVTYTAPASGGITVGHGLGVAPKFVVVKARGASGNWPAWHGSFASNRDLIELNLTNAKTTGGSSTWNDQFPSSTVFGSTVGLTSIANQTHVAYCFAEVEGFSKIGSYTGNGSANGPFVWCGFRPRYVLIKTTSSAGYSWEIFDTARDTYNASGLRLFAESGSAEVDSRPQIDFLANGFKLRATAAGVNANASTFMYMAFAEAPFKYANAR